MTSKKPDWLPNWDNPAEYEHLAQATNQEWAWEFLRRNPEYHADHDELTKFRENDDPQLNRLANEAIDSFYGPLQFTETSPLPVAFLVGTLLPAMHNNKERYPWIPEVCWRLVAKYNLKFPLDPAKPYQRGAGAFIECDNVPVIETTAIVMHPKEIQDDKKITISVDMDGHLEDQLNYIKGFLKAYKKQKKIRMSEYLVCLRLLDAKADNVQWNTIAKYLLNSKRRSTYDKRVKQANKLLNGGFFELSRSKLIPGKGNRIKQGLNEGKKFFETNASAPSMRQSLPNVPKGHYQISSEDTVIHLKRSS